MKAFSVLFLVIAFAVGAYTSNATYGTIYSNNPLISRDRIVVYPRNGQFVSQEVYFPKNGQVNNRIISGIRVIDHFTNKTGANPTLWSGGPGFKFSTISLKSQLSRGINSTVEIYAK